MMYRASSPLASRMGEMALPYFSACHMGVMPSEPTPLPGSSCVCTRGSGAPVPSMGGLR